MARTAITVNSLALNAENENPTATTIDATDQHVITAGDASRLLLEIVNTFAGSKAVTVKAGANPPAFRAGLGDLTITMGAQNDRAYVVLETARFAQADGTINIDVAASMTGTIRAMRLPKG